MILLLSRIADNNLIALAGDSPNSFASKMGKTLVFNTLPSKISFLIGFNIKVRG